MSYRIEKNGFEVRGFKLGQKVVLDDDKNERVIIGFSEDGASHFIAISTQFGSEMRHSEYATVVLDGYESTSYQWESQYCLSIVETNETAQEDLSDSQLPQDVSSIHAIEILEDVMKDEFVHEYFFGNDEGKLFSCYTQEQMNIMKQCIEVLKSM